MGNAARRAVKSTKLSGDGMGFNKLMLMDDLDRTYPETTQPLVMHATGVNPDSPDASIMSMGEVKTTDDLLATPWQAESENIPHGSQYAMINPYQYLMDTVYKPAGLEGAAKKRLENNPYFRAPGTETPDWVDLLIYNSDDAGRAGRGGYARRYASEVIPGYVGVGGYADNGPLVTRHESRHLITKPEVFQQPANADVSNALAESLSQRQAVGVRRDAPQSAKDAATSNAVEHDMLSRQNLDSVHEMIAHLGDAHDHWVRTQGRMVETPEDARAAMEAWANKAPRSVSVDHHAKRQTLMNAFNNGANDAMSRILRHMYAVPVAAGVAGSQQQQSPLQGISE
jgi:hypothetical protein